MLRIRNKQETPAIANSNTKCSDAARSLCEALTFDVRRNHEAMLRDMSKHVNVLTRAHIWDYALLDIALRFLRKAVVIPDDYDLSVNRLIAGLCDYADMNKEHAMRDLSYTDMWLLINCALERYAGFEESGLGQGRFQQVDGHTPRLEWAFVCVSLTEYGHEAAERGRSKINYPAF